MKQAAYSICFFTVWMFLQACTKTNVCSQQLKTLDSLGAVINTTIKELEKTDTVILEKAITRFGHYRQFIKQNISDTLTKSDADNLQQFYASGKNLEVFQTNKGSLLARARLVSSQLAKLTADVQNNALDAEEATRFILQEKSEAVKLADLGSSQKQLFYSELGEFKNSLRGVEQLIRSHNNGELPKIVKDTLSL